jgi:hypothetical protein
MLLNYFDTWYSAKVTNVAKNKRFELQNEEHHNFNAHYYLQYSNNLNLKNKGYLLSSIHELYLESLTLVITRRVRIANSWFTHIDNESEKSRLCSITSLRIRNRNFNFKHVHCLINKKFQMQFGWTNCSLSGLYYVLGLQWFNNASLDFSWVCCDVSYYYFHILSGRQNFNA